MTKNVVGLFCGTMVKIDHDYDVPTGEIKGKDNVYGKTDTSLSTLLQDIVKDDNTEVIAVDGCSQVLFAFDVEKKANDMVKRLGDMLDQNPNETLNVTLIGHSRGCLSIMDVVKKVSEDPKFKGKVEFTLDLRDPVPGNLDPTTKLDNLSYG